MPAVSLGESPMTTSVASFHAPMANLISITETLPPGSPRNGSPPTGPQPPRTSSRGSQNSPSSGRIQASQPAGYVIDLFPCPYRIFEWKTIVRIAARVEYNCDVNRGTITIKQQLDAEQ